MISTPCSAESRSELFDRRLVGAVAETREQRAVVEEEHVAAFGGGRRLDPGQDRAPGRLELRGDHGRFVAASFLAGAKQDRARIGDQRGVVRVDRVRVAGDRFPADDDVGHLGGESLHERRVFVGSGVPVGLGVPPIRLPLLEGLVVGRPDVDALDGVVGVHRRRCYRRARSSACGGARPSCRAGQTRGRWRARCRGWCFRLGCGRSSSRA